MWKRCESKFGMWIGWNAFVQGVYALSVKGERYFWKSFARDAPTRTHIIYAPKTDWYLRVLACPTDKTVVARDKIAVYAQNSLENFPHISYSRQKVVRLFRKSYHFFPYQLFPSLYQLFPSPYQLFPSQGTPIPRTRINQSAHGDCPRLLS